MPEIFTRTHRYERILDVELRDVDRPAILISSLSHTVNLSDYGILMDVPATLDACIGMDLTVTLRWPGGAFQSKARIVRFESSYRGDPTRSVMAIHCELPLPAVLVPSEA